MNFKLKKDQIFKKNFVFDTFIWVFLKNENKIQQPKVQTKKIKEKVE